MINLVSIGLIDCVGTISDIVIWDAFVIYGFVIGSGFAYFLKGNSVLGIKQIIDDIVTNLISALYTHSFILRGVKHNPFFS